MATDDTIRFHASLSQAATRVEDALSLLLPGAQGSAPDGRVAEAMRYATLSGGKRLRALLVIETAEMFNVPRIYSDRVAAAVECIHAYSLIHDDLPAMDDDDLRRGKPTVHVKWDEATAILAGDALQTLAFEILASQRTSTDGNVRLKLIQRLAQAVGSNGMVGGQAIDIAAATAPTPLTLQQITELQAKKTGALIIWSVEAGAILGKSESSALAKYAADLGLAFQIRDDILDVEGDPETAGKRLNKDAAAGKATFVSLLGMEGAKRMGCDLVARACASLEPYGSAAGKLRLAAQFAMDRTS